jgi:putative membrane protein
MAALLTEAELAEVQAATTGAEAKTSGEIVPYLVEQADEHVDGRYRAALLGAVLAVTVATALHEGLDLWGPPLVFWMLVPAWLGALIGFLACRLFPGLLRVLVPDEVIDQRVLRRAEAAFLHEEVFKTRDRTGILVFLALTEHRALILADSGIHQAVPKEQWQQLASGLAAGIKEGRAKEALIETIKACGALLVEHRLDIRHDDTNELADTPRIHAR